MPKNFEHAVKHFLIITAKLGSFTLVTDIEQNHVSDALVFELSKVETVKIRERMVSHLLNIDNELANKVAKNLGFKEMPKAAESKKPTRNDLKKSAALSILQNGPKNFKGRKLGIFLTDAADSGIFQNLKETADSEGVTVEIIASTIGGVKMNDGQLVLANHKIDGGSSVLFDAVVLLFSKEGAKNLLGESAARDFVSDAFSHLKYIGYSEAAKALMQKAEIENLDEACLQLDNDVQAKSFFENLGNLRYWKREAKVKAGLS